MEIIAVTLGWVLNQRAHLKGISTSSGGRWAFHPCDRPDGLTSTPDEDSTLLRSPLESSSHLAQATPPLLLPATSESSLSLWPWAR